MSPRSASSWHLVVDEATGAGIPCPPRWVRVEEPGATIAVVEPDPAGGRPFRANVTVVVEHVGESFTDVEAYARCMLDGLALTLTDLHVISFSAVHVSGHEGYRLVAGYRSGPYALSLEQWWTVADGVGTTLSGTCAVEDYLYASPIFEVAAAGLLLPNRVTGK